MRKRSNETAFSIALVALLSACLGAEGESEGEIVRLEEYREGQLAQFRRHDQDGNGVVSYKDLAPKTLKRYRRMDTDKDYNLTATEFERGIEQAFQKADLDKNGLLEPSEQH